MVKTIDATDVIYGNDGQDVLIGGAGGDRIDGGTDKDLIFGDNVLLDRTHGQQHQPALPRLSGAQLYSTRQRHGGDAAWWIRVSSSTRPGDAAVWEDFDVTILDHSFDDADRPAPNSFGNDYIAGGADDDQIFGQLGNDMIQGDGSIDAAGRRDAHARPAR